MRSCAVAQVNKRPLKVQIQPRRGAESGEESGEGSGAEAVPDRCRIGGPLFPIPLMPTARLRLALAFSGATAEPRENPSLIPSMSPL
jgi:hypothetical protein